MFRDLNANQTLEESLGINKILKSSNTYKSRWSNNMEKTLILNKDISKQELKESYIPVKEASSLLGYKRYDLHNLRYKGKIKWIKVVSTLFENKIWLCRKSLQEYFPHTNFTVITKDNTESASTKSNFNNDEMSIDEASIELSLPRHLVIALHQSEAIKGLEAWVNNSKIVKLSRNSVSRYKDFIQNKEIKATNNSAASMEELVDIKTLSLVLPRIKPVLEKLRNVPITECIVGLAKELDIREQ